MTSWQEFLGRTLGAEDQPPGFYRYRARRGAPWQALRILWDGAEFHCLLSGEPVKGSPAPDPALIDFILYRGPFHSVSETEYETLLAAYRAAPAGHPLRTPDEPVNLRGSKPL